MFAAAPFAHTPFASAPAASGPPAVAGEGTIAITPVVAGTGDHFAVPTVNGNGDFACACMASGTGLIAAVGAGDIAIYPEIVNAAAHGVVADGAAVYAAEMRGRSRAIFATGAMAITPRVTGYSSTAVHGAGAIVIEPVVDGVGATPQAVAGEGAIAVQVVAAGTGARGVLANGDILVGVAAIGVSLPVVAAVGVVAIAPVLRGYGRTSLEPVAAVAGFGDVAYEVVPTGMAAHGVSARGAASYAAQAAGSNRTPMGFGELFIRPVAAGEGAYLDVFRGASRIAVAVESSGIAAHGVSLTAIGGNRLPIKITGVGVGRHD